MKLKYNSGGEVQEIPLTTDKPQGKRLAVRKNGQTWYAPLVSVTDSTASNFRLVFGGEVCALAEAPTLQPEIENILIAPPRVSVMQGQSATATVSAEGNEAVAGLSFSIANNPTWITIADECILIQPSDNDLGEAIVEVIAKDTGSDASMSAAFVAESLLRPIITQLGIAPPAVTVAQGSTSTAIVHAEANSAVGGLSYSLDGAPSWIRNDNDTIWVEPTNNDIGTANVQVVAYDPNSSARADTSFTAEAVMVPAIYGVIASPSTVTVEQGDSIVVTLAAEYNSAVTGIEYSLEGAPPWMTISGNLITVAPTTEDLGSVTVTITARDTGSGVQASTQITAEAQVVQPKISGITVQPANGIKSSHVVAWQKNTLLYPLTCTANSAVTSVKYSLEGAPAWATVSLKSGNSSLRVAPTTTNSALGDSTFVTIVAYDSGSQVKAKTIVWAKVIEKPYIGALTLSETDVTGYPEKAATITITSPSVNSGVAGIEYSLSAQPDWVTLQGNKIIAAPATGETGYQVISIQAVDKGSTIVSSRSKCSVRASVCPELTSIKAAEITAPYKGVNATLSPTIKTSNGATYGIKYALSSYTSWMSIDSSTGRITLQTPATVPASSVAATGNYTVYATDPLGRATVSATASYEADRRDTYTPTLSSSLIANGTTVTSTSDQRGTLYGASVAHTLLVDVNYPYSIPAGNITLSGYYYSNLPSVNVTTSDRQRFRFKVALAKRSSISAATVNYGFWVAASPDSTKQQYPSDFDVFGIEVHHSDAKQSLRAI